MSTAHAAHRALNKHHYLDCTDEVTAVRQIEDRARAWLGGDLSTSDWMLEIDSASIDELRRAADLIARHPVEGLVRTPVDLCLPRMSGYFEHAREKLDDGVGFAVLDRLPVDEYPEQIMVELYWVIGQLIARPVAQKYNGQLIYDVRDTAQKYSYGVRGSWTNVELNFHTDNAFGKMPPDYVGLFCRRPARSGGVSRFCSLYSIHLALEQNHPQALRRLYEPMLYDRQKEHAEGEPPVTLAPFFSWRGGRLRARANPSLVRKGYQVAGITMEAELEDALQAVDKTSSAPELWYEAALERGQIQYLNNAEIGHYRSEFTDYDEPELKRHLYRLWHRKSGSVAYDGDSGTQAAQSAH